MAATVLVAASCSSNPRAASPDVASSAAFPRGGTLRVAVESDPETAGLLHHGLDPKNLSASADELLRCCLTRTLYSYRSVTTDEGGLDLLPDLAAALPEVSADGLSWTIHLRRNVHYGPPFTDRTITSADVVRGIERTLDPKAPGVDAPIYEVIKGVKEFENGAATTVAGLETPDDLTLVVRLVSRVGDLDSAVLTQVSAAPLLPAVADGHNDNFSHFLVSTGPYMLEGADQLDFSLPPDQQKPLTSFVEDQRLMLVRNPAWNASTDPVRAAFADRMEFVASGTANEAVAAVDRGDADLFLPTEFTASFPSDALNRHLADPVLRRRISVHQGNEPLAVNMNLAMPPFDDIHVRKAINLVLDKQALADVAGGLPETAIAGHLLPDAAEKNLLSNYDPYGSPGSRGDLQAAMTEMRKSAYDHDGDGLCDDPVCTGPVAASRNILYHPEMANLLAADLAKLGIHVDLKVIDDSQLAQYFFDPSQHNALFFDIDWGTGLPDAASALRFAFTHPGDPAYADFSLVGATPEQLHDWGYANTAVPNVDGAADNCDAQTGQDRVTCAATLDQQLMQDVVPWAPYQVNTFVAIVSARVVRYSFSESDALPGFDQIALASGSK